MVLTRYQGDNSHLSREKEPVSLDRRRQAVGHDHMAEPAVNLPQRQNCEELLSVPRDKYSAA